MNIYRKFDETDFPANFSNHTCTAFIALLELGIVNAGKYVLSVLRILAFELSAIPDFSANFPIRYVAFNPLF